MNIEPFHSDDIGTFLAMAAEENWVAELWEFTFLLSTFPQGCFAARSENGETLGFVTSLCHDRSGWIGNLIVTPKQRGRGIGATLFTTALGALRSAGAVTFWLTASSSGAPLYEKHGFTDIDRIIRWVGEGRQRHAPGDLSLDRSELGSSAIDMDFRAWGDRRSGLLAVTTGRGRLLHDESGFISLQPCGDSVQFGPFSALASGGAERLFDVALENVAWGTKVIIDAPASNRAALRMLNRKRMKIAGSNLLMYAGAKPVYRPELIYGLATMGSCG
ncbi:MAG TPA: GNAT family N-acetyltransferase [Desulfuromonadales bacterium]|nr:GNAT family N-acetyltransferase [Desulfuromonadales bacterium]